MPGLQLKCRYYCNTSHVTAARPGGFSMWVIWTVLLCKIGLPIFPISHWWVSLTWQILSLAETGVCERFS